MLRYLLSGHCAGAGALLLAFAPAAWSLGLGDIELSSALNEKLDAEIELIDAAGLQPTEIIVSLAKPEDFQRVGVERFFFLTDLRFEVAYDRNGVGAIKVSSAQPVTEPYLNFLVEVLWPSGRLLKEYTLLLDPPTYSAAAAPAVSAPAPSSRADAPAGRVERPGEATVSRGTQVGMTPRPGAASPLDQGVVDGEYRMTDRTDTLWSIASRNRPSSAVSVQQNMLAIQRLNPDAFLNGNINLLKAGYSLRLPSEQQALSLARDEADRMVALQNEDWRALQRGERPPSRVEQQVAGAEAPAAELQGRIDATPEPARGAAPAPAQDGELRIVAGDGSGGDAVGAAAMDAALEERDRLGREVSDLEEALDREREIASNQIAVKDRQLEVKDQQIAEMQAEMARLRQEMAQIQAAAADQRQNQSATTSWWQSPYVLGGGVGALVLLLAYGLIAARRRRAASEELFAEAESLSAPATVRHEPALAATARSARRDDVTQVPAAEPDPAAEADDAVEHPDAAATAVRDDGGSETGDVIGEADIYIAYGRYPQAIGLLLGVLEEDADRNDVRLKLLELYAETRDREAFDHHMTELLARCEDDEALLTARELGGQFADEPADGADALLDSALLDSGDDLLDADDGLNEPADEPEGLLDEPAAGDPPRQATPAEDFELELDDAADPAAARQAASAEDALGGDLGFDFDPERDHNGDAVRAGAAPDDLDLDLDLDLEDAPDPDDGTFDFGDEGDTAATKLDLARAYIDMGDQDGARDILSEVLSEGNAEQQQRAQAMLEEL